MLPPRSLSSEPNAVRPALFGNSGVQRCTAVLFENFSKNCRLLQTALVCSTTTAVRPPLFGYAPQTAVAALNSVVLRNY